jgi:hypothetical protein
MKERETHTHIFAPVINHCYSESQPTCGPWPVAVRWGPKNHFAARCEKYATACMHAWHGARRHGGGGVFFGDGSAPQIGKQPKMIMHGHCGKEIPPCACPSHTRVEQPSGGAAPPSPPLCAYIQHRDGRNRQAGGCRGQRRTVKTHAPDSRVSVGRDGGRNLSDEL